MFAFADEMIAAKTAAPIRILGFRGYTTVFGACPMPQESRLQRKNHFPKTFWSSLAIVAAVVGLVVGSVVGGLGGHH